MAEHVILVAFSVEAKTREEAATHLAGELPDTVESGAGLVQWWTAEDDRLEDSDESSAVFVYPGTQARASQLLSLHGLASPNSIIYDSAIRQSQRRKVRPEFGG